MANYDINVYDWKWESKIMKITIGTKYSCDMLANVIDNTESESKRTLHLNIEENILPELLPIILNKKYKFRAYENGVYQYYKWLLQDVEDKVHPYATSTAGASVLILSPDEKSILMVYENNNWKFVTGSNDFNELSIDTAKREMLEEVGLEVDPIFTPKILGFWNIGGRNGGKINEIMTCFVFKSKSKEFTIDQFELTDAAWFAIEDLRDIINIALETDINSITHIITHNNKKYGYPYILWLNNWLQHKYFDIHITNNVNIIF